MATPYFYTRVGCYTVRFWYHAYGRDVSQLKLLVEGVDKPVWDGRVVSKDDWVRVRGKVYADHPIKVIV